jgi:hypothetical protein
MSSTNHARPACGQGCSLPAETYDQLTHRQWLLAPSGASIGGISHVVRVALLASSSGLHSMAFHGAVSCVITLTAGLVTVCAAWHVLRLRGREPVDEA